MTFDLLPYLQTKKMPRLAAIAVVALLVSSEGVDAFGMAAAPGGGGAAKLQSHDRPSFPRRVLILPDSRAEVLERDLWHHHLKASPRATKRAQLRTNLEGITLAKLYALSTALVCFYGTWGW